jgi:ADP-heptose:LPS heptosyltransferase
MHVAAALARPSVIVFGPSDPAVALPRTGRFLAVQNAAVSCVPCLRNECPRFGGFYKECLRTVTPAAVLAALNEARSPA